jgi:hypothetical protein
MVQFARQQCGAAHVRLGSKADIAARPSAVRFTPESGRRSVWEQCPLCAINVRFASRRIAAKFASLFDEAGSGVRDIVS